MDAALEIRTLGELTITRQGEPSAIPLSGKARALLVYLAFAMRPCRREFLAELLWPGRSQTQSLTNLRKLLVELHRQVGPWVNITRETVALTSPFWLDASEISTCLVRAENAARDESIPEMIAALEAAVTVYRGDFLDGFVLESEEFDAWAVLERERLRFGITEVLDRLMEAYTRQRNAHAGMDCAARLFRLDSLREKTYRQTMRLLAETGQREAALHQFVVCQQTLQTELGIAPGPKTVALYKRIRSGEFYTEEPRPVRPAQSRQPVNLPPQATSFVGRQAEIQELLEQLDQPDCRLLTIGGPGGIGKTRLALEVARRAASRFSDGVCFVPLAGVGNTDTMLSALLSALSLRPAEDKRDPRTVLLNYLADKFLLLVLDNMEHLLADLTLVEAILAGAPRVRLLVTSRHPLALDWEWHFTLGGMAVPAGSDDAAPESYSGVKLFIERAQRVQHGFTLADDPAGVVHICQRVAGMPLGIEIAAAWVRVMPCAQIAAQLMALETPYQIADPRHHSLRALFESTWRLLDADEQGLLMQLSVFRGGFTAAAAAAVTGAQLPDLARLVRKALLGVNFRTNRYEFHPLLNEFLSEQLHAQPKLEAQTLDAHCVYFVEFIHAREEDIRSSQPGHAFHEIMADVDNQHAAWQHAIDQRRFDLVERCCTGLNAFLTMGIMHYEALDVFQQSLTALLAEPESIDRDRVELAVQACLVAPMSHIYGWEDHRLWPVAERIRLLAEHLGDDRQTLMGLITLVNLYMNEEWDRAVEVAGETIPLGQRLGRQEHMIACALSEAPLMFTGRLAQSVEAARATQALFDADDCMWGTMTIGMDVMAASLTHSGCALTFLGYADQGEADLAAARARAEALGQPTALCFALAFTTMAQLCTRETAKSRATGLRLKEVSETHRNRHFESQWPSYSTAGIVQRGDYEEGIAALAPAIEIERQKGLTHSMTSWCAHLGYAYGQTGQLEQGFRELHKAIDLMERTGERLYEAVIDRFYGELLLLKGDEAGAEASCEQAIAVAQRQEAKFHELQATLSLFRLLQVQGRAEEGYARLHAIYGWFTEGFDRPDLVEARQILASPLFKAALSRPQSPARPARSGHTRG
jgi:predicted ATPase/DNA-binding SARP family transcriptional activator